MEEKESKPERNADDGVRVRPRFALDPRREV